ncbi:CPBP family intramembrane glutamic endopeptidase [Ruminiclostridium josui]|uniref:CPBP family intramembrane glutamic endopeptidase n=1 Tax=Ruminiclostridium josui TaxID=1499 RepID=UPI000464424A|nr:CPBP family intramembrane glutamic endopeptidase [Ruminiclostridium josui]
MNKYKSIFIYIIFAFAIPLICLAVMSIVPLHSGSGYFILFGISAISPTSAALLTVSFFEREDSLVAFLKRCFTTYYNRRLCIFALIIPIIEIVIMQILLRFSGNQFALFREISFLQFLIVGYSLIAEEIGWRGFMQTRLDGLFPPFLTPLFIGIIWSLWHYHFYLIGSMTYPIHWFLIGCLADSYIYYWITKKANGNIVPASLLHFSYNLFSKLFFVSESRNHSIYAYLVIASIVIAVFIILRTNFLRKAWI